MNSLMKKLAVIVLGGSLLGSMSVQAITPNITTKQVVYGTGALASGMSFLFWAPQVYDVIMSSSQPILAKGLYLSRLVIDGLAVGIAINALQEQRQDELE